MKQHTLARNAIFNIIYKVVNVLFPLITTAYVSRILLPIGTGKVSYAQAIVSFFSLVAALGVPAYGTKVISQIRNAPQEERNKNITALLVVLLVSSLICSVSFYLFVALSGFFAEKELLYILGLQIVFVAINVDWFFQGNERYGFMALRNAIIKAVSLILIFIFVRKFEDFPIYAAIIVAGTVGNHLFNFLVMSRSFRFDFKGLKIRQHLAPIFVLLASSLAIELYSKIDVTMIGSLIGEEAVGYYSNSVKIINIAVTAVTAITTSFLPRLSLSYKENKNEFENITNIGLEVILFLSIPACVGLVFIAPELVKALFGDEFAASASPLRILAPLIVIKSAGDLLCYQLIIAAGKEKYFLVTNISAALVNILLNSLFIPWMNENGAALASVISECIVNFGMLFVTLKIVKIHLRKKVHFCIAVGVLTMSLTLAFLRSLPLSTFPKVMVCIVSAAVIYITINALLKNPLYSFFLRKKRLPSKEEDN